MGGEWNEQPFTQIRADGKRYPLGEGPDHHAPPPDWMQFLINQGVDMPNLLTSIATSAPATWPPLNRILDTVGDGTGTTDVTGDYSALAETFLIVPGVTETFEISQLQVEIETAVGGNAIRPWRYGDLLALTNGIDIHTHDGVSVLRRITEASKPIQDNRDWIRNAYEVSTETDQASGFMHILWDFAKQDAKIVLDGAAGHDLRVVVNDDFTSLVGHTFTVKGTVIS